MRMVMGVFFSIFMLVRVFVFGDFNTLRMNLSLLFTVIMVVNTSTIRMSMIVRMHFPIAVFVRVFMCCK